MLNQKFLFTLFSRFFHLKIRVHPPSAAELILTEAIADPSHLRKLMDVVRSEVFFPRFTKPNNEVLYNKYLPNQISLD